MSISILEEKDILTRMRMTMAICKSTPKTICPILMPEDINTYLKSINLDAKSLTHTHSRKGHKSASTLIIRGINLCDPQKSILQL